MIKVRNLGKRFKDDYKIVVERFETYIKGIIEVYGEYISEENLNKLRSIEDYSNYIFIERTGQINAFFREGVGVFLPLEAYEIVKQLKQMPQYGIDKYHKLYDEKTRVVNDNTFFDYINHVIVSGSEPLDYYEDLLLHETMHFCGSGGASALKEGVNEYLTRKIALKKGFRTSFCGYPKEVRLVKTLEEIYGEKIINFLAFINDENEMLDFIESELGVEKRNLFCRIYVEAENEFYDKYYRFIDGYDGLEGVKAKTINYEEIDYSKVYSLINAYKKVNKRR